MSIETVTGYLQTYGYWVILLTLFCGIVGIPAPEETFLVLIGMLVAQHYFVFQWSLFSALLGTFVGMMAAYFIGRGLGHPFLQRYGRFIKITEEQWEDVHQYFQRHGKVTTIFGLFLPGLRQIAPYIAGTIQFSFPQYLIFSMLGSFFWTTFYITIGYFVGDRISLEYLPWIAFFAFAAFLVFIYYKKRQNRKHKEGGKES